MAPPGFSLVFLSTFPVVVPFMVLQNIASATCVSSNGVAIAMLFGAGYMLARYAGMPPVRTGLIMVTVGAVFVAITIALGELISSPNNLATNPDLRPS